MLGGVNNIHWCALTFPSSVHWAKSLWFGWGLPVLRYRGFYWPDPHKSGLIKKLRPCSMGLAGTRVPASPSKGVPGSWKVGLLPALVHMPQLLSICPSAHLSLQQHSGYTWSFDHNPQLDKKSLESGESTSRSLQFPWMCSFELVYCK